uniref:Glutamine amidotransferase type-2 domain-containing protein n=1 Tax=viral metagenome TaxID=1070528 RepID=A0A6C0HTP8_9ZZZZ
MCQLFLSIKKENGKQLLEKFINKSKIEPVKDGYGITWYQNNKWNVYKNNVQYINDTNYNDVITNIHSNIIIAHLRRVYNGANKKEILEEKIIENNHPFYYEDWVFVLHGDLFFSDNKNVFSFQKYHREPVFKESISKLMNHILPKYKKMIKGKTDSEIIFYLFLSIWENLSKEQKMYVKQVLYICLLQVLDIIQKSGFYYSFSFIIAKDKYILVTNCYYNTSGIYIKKVKLYIDKSNDDGVVICSSKMTDSSKKMVLNTYQLINF